MLHLGACLAALFVFGALRRMVRTRVDTLLLAWLVLGAVSAVFATNPWLAARALAISISSVLLFWTARALREAGRGRSVLAALGFGLVLVAIGSLLQTYGVETDLFSINRAPGGTLGNRNFVAHAAAFGFPVLLFIALEARRFRGWLGGALGAAILTGTLVLTRSRAAWLAFAAVLLLTVVAMLFSPQLRRSGRTWARLAGVLVLAAAGVAGALLVPNTLDWRSDEPYLDTARRLADYEEGSGRGRLIQYGRSLRIAAVHPILGVGPGNWAVEYPEFAVENDPSMDPSPGGMTFNPWPSSDWIAWIAERGPIAVAVLAAAFALIALRSLRQLRVAASRDEALDPLALLAILAGAVVTGLFDAVLLLAFPSFFVWTALGAAWTPPARGRGILVPEPTASLHRDLGPGPGRPGHTWWTVAVLFLVIASGAAAARSMLQIAAMEIYATREDRESLELAAKLDPGNYDVRMRLARWSSGDERCEHALAAVGLYPNADAAQRLARGCE